MEVNFTLLIQLLLFIGLLVWLSRVLFKPLLALFEERDRRIQGARLEAEVLQKQAQQKLAEVNARILEAQKEAQRHLNVLQTEGARFYREMVEAAKQQSNAELQKARQRLKIDFEQARTELLGQEMELTHQVMGRMTESGHARA